MYIITNRSQQEVPSKQAIFCWRLLLFTIHLPGYRNPRLLWHHDRFLSFLFIRLFETKRAFCLSGIDSNMRRALILISKILQSVTNGVLFGEKEVCFTLSSQTRLARWTYIVSELGLYDSFERLHQRKRPCS